MSSTNEWVASEGICVPPSLDTLLATTDLASLSLPTLLYQLSFLHCVSVSLAPVSGLDLTAAVEAVCAGAVCPGSLCAQSLQFHYLCPIRCLFVLICVFLFVYSSICFQSSLPISTTSDNANKKDRHSLHSSQRTCRGRKVQRQVHYYPRPFVCERWAWPGQLGKHAW